MDSNAQKIALEACQFAFDKGASSVVVLIASGGRCSYNVRGGKDQIKTMLENYSARILEECSFSSPSQNKTG